jgi:hypothetical protein
VFVTEALVPEAKGMVIYYHGNGEAVSNYTTVNGGIMTKLNNMGFSASFVEYRGYHPVHCSGLQTMDNIAQDTATVIEAVKKRHSLTSAQIVVFGRSIGSLPAICSVASAPSSIIIESGFSSEGLQKRVKRKGLTGIKCLPLTEILTEFGGRVLIFGSKDDHIVPCEENYIQLVEEGTQKASVKVFKCFDMGRHNVSCWNEEEYFQTLASFLAADN